MQVKVPAMKKLEQKFIIFIIIKCFFCKMCGFRTENLMQFSVGDHFNSFILFAYLFV